MPRSRRVFPQATSAHLIQRGNNRSRIFESDFDYVVLLELLRKHSTRCQVDIHGFVLMTNHYHLLATPTDEKGIPQMMKAVGGGYVRYYNRQYARIGTLWNGRYRSLLVEDERYWLTCLRYIEHNPVRAGMVRSASDYRWSSYRPHALGSGFSWLASHPVYLSLGSTRAEQQRAYQALCLQADDADGVALINGSAK